ncbi:MAG: PAS domain S-box protein [Campylobacterales bacterium]|nr:PAS domain S-box protein [Campylobacterales bacterium]
MIKENSKTELEQIYTLEIENAKYKQTQIQLRESEEKYRQLFENSRDALMTLSPPSWKFSSANKAALQLFGIASVAEFTALGPWDISPQQQPDGRSSTEKAQEMIETAMRDGSNFFEWEHQTIDGKVFPTDVLITRLELSGQILAQATVRDITKHKQMEMLLKQERDFSNRLIETAPVIIMVLSPEGKIVRFNNYMEIISGYSLKEVEGKDWFDTFLPEDQREKTKRVFLHAIDDIQTNGNVNPILTKEGSQKLIEWYDKTLKNAEGNTIGLLSIGLDVTDRKQAEEAFRKSEEKFRALVESTSDWIWEIDTHGSYTYVNPQIEKLLGYRPEEVLGKSPFDFIPPEEVQRVIDIFVELLDKRAPMITLRNTNRCKDGSLKVLETSGVPFFDEKGEFAGYRGIDRDITERIRMEEKLNLFRLLLDHSSDAIEIIEPSTMRFLDINETECKTLGYSKEEMLSMSVFDIDPMFDAEAMKETEKKLFQEGKLQLEGMHRRKDGSLFPVEVSVTLIEHDKTYILSIARDITERKIAEQALRESEEKFHSITASAQDAIIMMDNGGIISYWNEAAEKIFGYSEKEALGQILHTFITPQRFLAAHLIGFAHFKETGEGPVVGKTLELVAVKKGGMEFPIELSLSATMIGGLWNAIGIIRDITDRKKMESELKRKDEMMIAQAKQTAMGDMIAMIAHQWRQPLTIISMGANNLQIAVELEEEITLDLLKEYLETLNKEVEELAKTIDNFSNYFRPNQSKEYIKIEEVLKSTLDIIGISLENEKITLNLKNSSQSPIFIVKSSLIQVLLNIFSNAKEVLVANKVEHASITTRVSETKEAITLSICDNGGGIPPSIMGKIGQPYFTTKQEFNGVGLGLYISRTIVEKHLCGTLTWHNEDKGACFVITLNTLPLER